MILDWDSLPDAPVPGGNNFDQTVAQIESNGNPNASNPKSSAKGLFQFTDSTAKQYGLDDPTDPIAATGAFHELTNDNKASLQNSLGRDPSEGELYLAHQQGASGAAKLLANPDATAASIVGKAAVIHNGGNVNMKAGDFANLWINKYNLKAGLGQGTQVADLDWDSLPDAPKQQNIDPATLDWDSLPDAPKPMNTAEATIQGASHGVLPFGVGQNAMSALTATGGVLTEPLLKMAGAIPNSAPNLSWMEQFKAQNKQADDANLAALKSHPYAYVGGDLGAGVLGGYGLGKGLEKGVTKLITNPEVLDMSGIAANSNKVVVGEQEANAMFKANNEVSETMQAYNAERQAQNANDIAEAQGLALPHPSTSPATVSSAEQEFLQAQKAYQEARGTVNSSIANNPEGYNAWGQKLKGWNNWKTLVPDIFKGAPKTPGAALGVGAEAYSAATHSPSAAALAYGVRNVLPYAGGKIAMNLDKLGSVGAVVGAASSAFTPINAKVLPMIQQSLGSYAPILNAAASRGPANLTAVDFQLQGSDPNYRQMVQDLSQKNEELNDKYDSLQAQTYIQGQGFDND